MFSSTVIGTLIEVRSFFPSQFNDVLILLFIVDTNAVFDKPQDMQFVSDTYFSPHLFT